MALYTNFKKNNNKSRFTKSQKLGIVFICIASLGYFFLISGFLSFIKLFLIGTFGVFSYVIFLGLLTIGTALFKNKRYVLSKKYTLLASLCLLCVLCIFHISFSGGVGNLTFGQYLSNVYHSLSVAGALLSMLLYPILKFLGMVGTYIVFFVTLTLCLAFIINKQDNKKIVKKYKNLNLMIEDEPIIIKKEENLAQEIFKQPKQQTLSQKEIARERLGLNKIKNQNFAEIENKNTNFFNNQSFEPAFKENDGFIPPKMENRNTQFNGFVQSTDNTNNYYTKKKNKTNLEKNMEFLRATLGQDEYKPPILMEDVIPQKKKDYNTNIEDNLKNSPISELLKEVKNNINIEEKPKEDLLKNSSLNLNFNEMQNNRFDKKFQQSINQTAVQQKNTAVSYKKKNYVCPSMQLLSTISSNAFIDEDEISKKSALIENTLNSFKIPAKVNGVTKGPAVTRYELEIPSGIRVNKVEYYANDIKAAVRASHDLRIEAPIPGKNAVGVEVPNNEIATVSLKEVLDSKEFTNSKSLLTFGLGKEISGAIKVCDLIKMPHLLVAGATGSGKSVCLNAIILSIIFRASPEDVRFILIDPKRVEFFMYNKLPHLLTPSVITESDKALNAFNFAIDEMERRYNKFQDVGVRNLEEYNNSAEVISGRIEKMPYIVFIVDELFDLIMTNKREFEDKIIKLAQKARAAGIHLILATQRPSVDVITGTIKANLPSRIAFAVQSYNDSRTIIDNAGAEKLLGKGDMLYSPLDYPEPVRIQGAFVSNNEVNDVVQYVIDNNPTNYDESIIEAINKTNKNNGNINSENEMNDYDPMLPKCLKHFIETGRASVSMLQRRFALGFPRASRIIDQMEMAEYISPQDGAKPRSVFLTMDEFIDIFGEIED